MPTTKLKNAAYRFLIPLKSPRLGKETEFIEQGRRLITFDQYRHFLRKHHVMGSACLVADENEQACIISSSDHPKHIVARNSLFRVASITKMASALTVLKAVEEEKLDLETPIQDLLPENMLCPELQDVLIIQLLSHTSGLIDPPNLENALLNGIPFPDLMKGSLRDKSQKPFHYSNLGYGLLGCLLEAAYNQPVSDIVREKVFKPLEMNATLEASSLDPGNIVPITRILPFDPKNEIVITELGKIPLNKPDPLRHYGHTAGAMYTDIDSLHKLMKCIMKDGKPVLESNIGRKMKEDYAAYGKLDKKLFYGLGLLIIRDPNISESRILGHQGFAYGCADGAFWEEDTGRMIIFLNGGASEARVGRLGLCNRDLLRWAMRKELPKWSVLQK